MIFINLIQICIQTCILMTRTLLFHSVNTQSVTVAEAKETLRPLLNKIAKEHKYGNPEIIINEISSGGANYTSKLFTVIIKEEKKEDLHLFAKVATMGEAFRKDMPIDVYKNEVFAYTRCAKIYASLEEANGVPEEHRLKFTKLYGFDLTKYKETLVLENLLAHGYGPHDRFHSVTWEYASTTVADLAKMHALSFAFSKQHPEEFEKVLAEKKLVWDEFGSMYQLMQKMTTIALKNVKPENKVALQKFMEKQGHPFKMYRPIRSTVIVHGDFRGDNLLHRVGKDGKVEIKIVDLQGLQGGSPVADLIFFIFNGSDEQFRAKYFDKLLDHYYTQLSAAMKRLNVDPEETFSRKDFDYEMKEKLPFGLPISIIMLPVITMDSQDTPEVNDSLALNSFSVDKPSDLYVERLNGVVNDYIKWGILKDEDKVNTQSVTVAEAKETLRPLLNKIAKEHKYRNPEIITNEVSSGGANYTSKLFTVIIKEENKENLHLFAKVATMGEAFRKDMPIDGYKNEVFAYTRCAKIYASLEEANGVPEEHRLKFTKLYGFDLTKYKETLVLENLLAHGYGPHDRFHSVTWEYASTTVADLAKMHALSFAFSKQHPEEFEKVLAEKKLVWDEFGSMYQLMQKMTTIALKNVKPENKVALQKFMEKQGHPFKMYRPIRSTVIVHGDFRGDNLLHRVGKDGKVEIKIVDLQGLQGGSPVADLIFFIFNGSDEQFRAKYFDKLLDHYYTQLSAAMKRLNVDPEETFSRKDFDYEMKEKLPFGLPISIIMLPVITMDSQDTPEVNDSLALNSFSVDKPSDLYVERLNGVVNDYIKWGILKDEDKVNTQSVTVAEAKETLRPLLNKIAKEHKYRNPEIITNEVSSGGANYTSKLFTVIIKEENKENLHLFAKVATMGEAFRKDMPIDGYKNEVFAYTRCAKIYASLEEANGVPEEHRLKFTKLYGFDLTKYKETLVLENLLAHGYGPHDRFHSVTWEYASTTVADLAKMHALSFAFSKQHPEEFEKVLAEKKLVWDEFGSMYQLMQKMTTIALNNVKPENKVALQKFMEKQGHPFKMYRPIRSTVIVHGDFRGDNLLHRVRKDGKVEIKIVDLQGLQGGSPVADLIYFIFTSSDEQFRAKYFDKLLDHYYTQLSAAMKRLNVDPEKTFSRKDFDYEMKEKLPFGLPISIILLPVITMDSHDTPEVNDSLAINSFSVDKPSDLYVERLNGVVNDYVKWGILKNNHKGSRRCKNMCNII